LCWCVDFEEYEDKTRVGILKATRIQDEGAEKTARYRSEWSSLEVTMVERAQIFVIDSSVAVKWYVEEDREKAVEVGRDYVEGKIDLG
jgi:hypothetical protein